jgi:hypothetical protein
VWPVGWSQKPEKTAPWAAIRARKNILRRAF